MNRTLSSPNSTAGHSDPTDSRSDAQSGNTTYVVQSGDSLYLIARRLGVGLSDLISANSAMEDPTSVRVGQILEIPSASHPSLGIRCLAMRAGKLTPRAEGAVILDYQRGRISVLAHDLPVPSHLSCETYKVWVRNGVTGGYDVALLYPTPAGVWAAGLQARSPLQDYDGVIITGESAYNDQRPLGPVAVSAAIGMLSWLG